MCRMITSAGKVPNSELIRGFLEMSQGLYEINELNKEKGKFKHDSGWGSVYESNNGFAVYRSTSPCWEDVNIKTFSQCLKNNKILILHARRASKSTIEIKNTHPFRKRYQGRVWFFCHNGTLRTELPEYPHLEGETDSEKLFMYMLEHFDEKKDITSIQRAAADLRDYSALNFFLFNGQHVYILNQYVKFPEYYTMKAGKGDDVMLVSSESLPGIDVEWQSMENGQIAKLNIEKAEIELS